MENLDEMYMKMALELAEKGAGQVSPNPMVGAVIVKEGRVIGQGWHRQYGGPHAERNALADCRESPEGAVMYVTLEPCCHHGHQPPCTDAILEAGIRRVVSGCKDPNPLVGGKGIRLLRDHGVEVTEGVLEEECRALNRVFFHFIRTKRPYVTMKYAMTMDGKIAAFTGASRWITGEEARAHVHLQRSRNRGIMAGIGTVLADDPLLTCRMEGGQNPVRIICDSHLRLPLDSRILSTAGDVPTILAVCDEPMQPSGTDRAGTLEERIKPYLEKGCRVLTLPERDGHIDPEQLMDALGREGIDSILLEGGGTLNWSMLKAGLVRRLQLYLAPMILGGETAKTPVEGQGCPSPAEGFFLWNSRITRLGQDLLIESEVC